MEPFYTKEKTKIEKLPVDRKPTAAAQTNKTKTVDIIKPRKMEDGNIIFLHVAKSAGTALYDFLVKNVVLKAKGAALSHVNGYILVNKAVNSKEMIISIFTNVCQTSKFGSTICQKSNFFCQK